MSKACLPTLVTIDGSSAIGDILVIMDKDDWDLIDLLAGVFSTTERPALDVCSVEAVAAVAIVLKETVEVVGQSTVWNISRSCLF